MSLDFVPDLTGQAEASGASESSDSTPSTHTPRVIAVVIARTPANLAAVLAGIAAQSSPPDVLVGVDCTGSSSVRPGLAVTYSATSLDENDDEDEPDAFAETFADVYDPDDQETGYDLEPVGLPRHAARLSRRLGRNPGASRAGAQGPPGMLTGEFSATSAAGALPEGDAGSTGSGLLDANGNPMIDQGQTELLCDPEAVSVYDLLAQHCSAVLVQPARARTTAAVNAALAWADAHAGDSDPDTQEWIWLLGGADRPSMKALQNLRATSRTATNIAVLGAKHRCGPTGGDLLDAGLTTTRLGRVLSFVEPGEPDQGQRDDVADTLAVPLSGMLVRRDVWARLAGLDPALDRSAPLDAAVDLCRRTWLAGNRVVVVPSAVLTAAPEQAPVPVSRRARTHRRLAGAPLLAVPFVALSVLGGGVLRVLGGLVAKEPLRAIGLAAASLVPLLRPDQVIRARWRALRTRTVPRRRLIPLLATARETWQFQYDRWQRSRPRLVSPAGTDAGPPVRTGVLVLTCLLLAAGVVALRRIVLADTFSSASLAAIPTSERALWHAVTSSWVPAGLGRNGPSDPVLGVLAVLGLPFGSPQVGVQLLLLVALPLAALSAWWAAGALTRRRGVRVLVGLAWAGTPIMLLGLAEGRLSVIFGALFLPAAARAVGQAVAARTWRSSWAWSAGAGLLLVPGTAALPVLAVAGVVILLCVAARSRRLAVAFASVPALVMTLPVLLSAWVHPALLFAEPSQLVHRGTPAAWAGLLGWPVPPSTVLVQVSAGAHRLLDGPIGAGAVSAVLAVVPWLVGTLPAALALISLRVVLRGTVRGAVCRAGWLLAAVGVGLCYLAPRFVVGVDADGPVRASTAAGTLLACLGLLVAGAATWGSVPEPVSGAAAAVRRGGVRALLSVGCVVTIVGLLGWIVGQLVATPDGDLRAGARPPLPAVVVDAATSPDQVRVVVLRALPNAEASGQTPALQVSVLRGEGQTVLDSSAAATLAAGPVADAADDALASAVVRTVNSHGDVRPVLAPFGIGAFVLLPGTGQPARDATSAVAADLDAALGLGPSGTVSGVRAWRVDPTGKAATTPDRPAAVQLVPSKVAAGAPSRVAVASDQGDVDVHVRTQAATLVLGERADRGWQATFAGRPLTPVLVDGWAQGFRVPAGTGDLVVKHVTDWQRAIGWAQVIVLLVALVIALPVRARTQRQPERAEAGA